MLAQQRSTKKGEAIGSQPGLPEAIGSQPDLPEAIGSQPDLPEAVGTFLDFYCYMEAIHHTCDILWPCLAL